MPNGGSNITSRTVSGSGTFSTCGFLDRNTTSPFLVNQEVYSDIGLDILLMGDVNTGWNPMFSIRIHGGGVGVGHPAAVRTSCNVTNRAIRTSTLAWGFAQGQSSALGAGTYNWSVDTVLDISFADTGYRAYGGEGAIPRKQIVVRERTRSGGTATVTVNLPGGVTVTSTGTVVAGLYIEPRTFVGTPYGDQGYGVEGWCSIKFFKYTAPVSAYVTMAIESENLQRGVIDNFVSGLYEGKVDFTNGCLVEITPVLLNATTHRKGVFNYGALRSMTIKSGVNQFTSSYPTALTGEVMTDTTRKDFTLGTGSVTLDNAFCASDRDTGLDNASIGNNAIILYKVMEGASVSFGLKASELDAIGDTQDLLMPIRLVPYDAITVSKDANYLFDPCDNATGWTNGTLVGGDIRIDSAVGAGTKTYPALLVSEGWRYLDLQIRPNTGGALPYTVEIWTSYSGSNHIFTYESVTGAAGSFSTQRIDLCAPTNITSAIDLTDSRWPVLGVGGTIPLNEGGQWGLNRIAKIVITFPGSSGTYLIRQMSLEKSVSPRLTFLSSLARHKLNTDISSPYVYRGIIGDSDGRRSFEMWVHSTNNERPLLSQGRSQFEFITGWHCTIPTTHATKWFYDTTLAFVGGNGIIYTGQTPIVSSDRWIHRTIGTSPTTVKGQAMVVAGVFPPKIGRILVEDGAGMGSETVICLWKHLRAEVSGLVIDYAQQPVVGATVTINEVGSVNASGSGTTDVHGYYESTANFPKTVPNQKIQIGGQQTTQLLYHRELRRISFSVVPDEDEQPWHIQDRRGNQHLATIHDGDVRYRRASSTVPLPSWAYESTVTSLGDCTFAAMAIDHRTSRIHMVIERSSGGPYSLWSCFSDSDGRDFSAPVSFMPNARFGVPWEDAYGGIGVSWFEYDSGTSGPGKQKAVYRGPGDTAYSAPFTFVDSTNTAIAVAENGWSNVRQANDTQGRLTWTPIIDGESIPSVWHSFDGGHTWTRV